MTNASSMPVCAAATYPPNTLENAIEKPTSSIVTVARAVFWETTVPSAISTAPTRVAVR